MKECVECGSNLGLLNRYFHPMLGKNRMVCGHCFSQIDTQLTKWRSFVLQHSEYVKNLEYTGEEIKHHFMDLVPLIMSNQVNKNYQINENLKVPFLSFSRIYKTL